MVLRLGCSRWRALHVAHYGTLFARPNTHKSRATIRRGNYISLDCPSTCIARCYCPGGQAATEAQCPYPLSELPALHDASTRELREFMIKAREYNNAAVQEGRLTGIDAPTIDDLNMELGWLIYDIVDSHQQSTGAFMESLMKPSDQSVPLRLRLSLSQLGLLWKRRLEERVPLQYLTNSAHWRDMVLAVQPGVLIPRPETELMIDFAKEAAKKHPKLASTTWVDLGTGSGALALGLAREVTKAAVKAVDLSPIAVKTAQLNVSRMGLVSRVEVFQGTWGEPLLPELQGRCGGVLSNPPYIATEVLRGLQEEVSRHEPWLALDGGSDDALKALKAVAQDASCLLAPGGFLALETGGGTQARLVGNLLKKQGGFQDVRIRADLAGIERFVTAYRIQDIQ